MGKTKTDTATASTSITIAASNEVDVNRGYEEMSGAGFDAVRPSDIIIPRIMIAQALSPQCVKSKPEYIEGCSPGDIIDPSIGKKYEAPLLFIPCFYRKEYLEWAPRNSNKGLVKIHSDASILSHSIRKPEDSRAYLPNGNYIAETAEFFGLNVSDGLRKSFVPMTSTQLKKARQWLTLASSERAGPKRQTILPLFHRVYQLSSVAESNEVGNWYGWRIVRGVTIDVLAQKIGMSFEDLRDECWNFCQQIRDQDNYAHAENASLMDQVDDIESEAM